MKTLIIYLLCWVASGISSRSQADKPVEVDGLFYKITGSNTVSIIGSEREEAVLEIPSEITIKGTNYKITGIENHLLDINKKGEIKKYGWGRTLKKVIVPNTVKRIGLNAFAYQSYLEDIELPASVQSIGGYAFGLCTSLKRIRIPEGVTVIAAHTFDGCKNLQKVILPESLQKIYIGAFQNCSSLTDINIPSKVDEIDASVFRDCGIWALDLSHTQIKTLDLECVANSALGYVSFPEGITQFTGNSYANGNCLYHMDYTTLKALEQNGKMNFLNNIHHLAIRNTESINKNYCPNVVTLILTGPIREISPRTFKDNTYLRFVYLDGPQIQNPKTGKIYHFAPSSITKIGTSAFWQCSNIISVKFPQTLTTIEDGAFHDCSKLERIDLPLSVEHIEECAFWNCVSVREITGLNSSISYGYYQGRSDPFLNIPNFDLKQLQQTFTYFAIGYLKKELQEWERKKEFETTSQWQQRVTVENRDKRVKELIEQAKKAYIAQAKIPALKVTLGSYDADYNTYRIDAEQMGSIYVQVPINEAPAFKENFEKAGFTPTYGIKDNQLALTSLTVTVNGKTYRNIQPAKDDNQQLLAQLPPLSINLRQDAQTEETIDQSSTKKPISPADVDTNIPTTETVASTTFAVIIANENYTREAHVPFAARDGEIFARYCHKTLGIPEKNIRLVKNATLNDMKFQLNWLNQVLTAHDGQAKAIVYYAGHGIPGESDQTAYLLPADGYGSDPGTGYALKDFYTVLGNAPAESVTVFLDACFSGTKRESGMMTSARGVAIKVKSETPRGNMVVFSAAQGDETAYQYAEKGHGMFTYFLLKKLQETCGEVTLGELSDYVTKEVEKASIVNNNKIQTPSVIPSPNIINWQIKKLK